jgi:cytochrome c-type biogenesis protein CcmH
VLLTMLLLGMIFIAALPSVAQEATQPITFDMVNKIARELYCPVCPNETLDACQTQACAQWRDEIRNQLAAGQSEQQIIDSFVRRYGDRVLGTPQDPALRALSLLTPFLIAALALIIGTMTFLRWRRRSPDEPPPAAAGSAPPIRDDYRSQLEQDLRE